MAEKNTLETMVRDELGQWLKGLAHVRPEQRAAEQARLLIIRHTSQGRDRTGAPLAPYAASTQRRKARRGQQTSPPNLSDTGQMMSGLIVRGGRQWGTTRRAEVVTQRGRDERLMRFHRSGTRKMPRRDVWGLSPQEVRAVVRTFGGAVETIAPSDRRKRLSIRIET